MPDIMAYQKTYNGKKVGIVALNPDIRIVSNIDIKTKKGETYHLNYGIKLIYDEGNTRKDWFLEFANNDLRAKFYDNLITAVTVTYSPLTENDVSENDKAISKDFKLTPHISGVMRKICRKTRKDYTSLKSLSAFEHFTLNEIRNIIEGSYVIPVEKRKPELWALTLAPVESLKLSGYTHLQIWNHLCKS